MSQFNALTGPELKQYLLTKISEQLDRSDKFSAHLTHPWFQYTFEIGLNCYPEQAKGDKPIIVAKGLDSLVDVAAAEEELRQAGEMENITSTGVVDTPDLARMETNQPIPTTVKGEGNVLVDKPLMPKFPDKKGK